MNRINAITERVRAFLAEIPAGITVVAAAKTRSAEEIRAAIAGGIRVLGANYVQEAQAQLAALEALGIKRPRPIAPDTSFPRESIEPPDGDRFSPLAEGQAFSSQREGLAGPRGTANREGLAWDMIGHLQRNKAKAAVQLFDRIQTLDSLRLAKALNTACQADGRPMPMLIEVNSAREDQKHGIVPEEVPDFLRRFAEAELSHVRIEGLMTMGAWSTDPEDLRPFFAETRTLFERFRSKKLPGVEMKTLSMGMSDSYRVALEEGATMIRVGTSLFGPRES